VITVGAADDLAGPDVSDDEMSDFSSVGPTAPDGWAKPDLVTSGRSVLSLAAPGSTIYDQNPSARVGSGNFVGSGTSFSAAVTSGAAALVLSDHPGLTPDQVKARLLGNTDQGPVGNPFVDGHGALNAYAAATSGPMNFRQSALLLLPSLVGQTVSLSPLRGISTWNASRWSGTSWSPGSGGGSGGPPGGGGWDGNDWVGSAWNGWAWTGSAWNTGGWTGSAWNSSTWTGSAWNGGGWTGSAWNGSAWNGGGWNSSAWD
jgi:serine protease AprX